MKLLLSNDDGVHAPGLARLAEELAELAEIQVVAPDRDRSGASNSLTLDRPLHPIRLSNGFICVNGTPTDCVHLGITGLLHAVPDMVIAGINAGANLGDDVLYSGTVAAAMEGRFLGAPALAVSLVGREHYDTAARITRRLVAGSAHLRLPPRTILNVNVPDLPLAAIKGIQHTRLGHRARAQPPLKTCDPRGKERYWIAVAGEGEDAGPGTDFHAVAEGYISITPLQVDMTRYEALDGIKEWLEELP